MPRSAARRKETEAKASVSLPTQSECFILLFAEDSLLDNYRSCKSDESNYSNDCYCNQSIACLVVAAGVISVVVLVIFGNLSIGKLLDSLDLLV